MVLLLLSNCYTGAELGNVGRRARSGHRCGYYSLFQRKTAQFYLKKKMLHKGPERVKKYRFITKHHILATLLVLKFDAAFFSHYNVGFGDGCGQQSCCLAKRNGISHHPSLLIILFFFFFLPSGMHKLKVLNFSM